MKPTVQAGRKKRAQGPRPAGGRPRGGGGGALPAIGRSPHQAQQGRHSLPMNTRATPRKVARHVKTSPELFLPELEHRMVDAVQSSSDAIAELRKSMGIAAPAATAQASGRPPRHPSVGRNGPNSSRGAAQAAAGGGSQSGEDLREAYEMLLERTEVLSDELEELREQERRQKVSGSTLAAQMPEGAEVGELDRLRSLIAGLEQGVQTSSAQLESLRGRFEQEVQAKAAEVEAAVRSAEQKRVDELERALKVSSSTNATMESALADMKNNQEKKQEKKRLQSDYGQMDAVTDELQDATVPSVEAGDVTAGEVDQLRLAWAKAFERRSAVGLVKLFAPNGRLQGSLSAIAKRDAPPAAPLSGASAITEYFNGLFQRYTHVKVQGAGMLQTVDPAGLQAIAEGTAVWSTVAELHLYDHPQDVTFKAATVSFVFTLRRLSSDQGMAVQILSQHCVVTALVRGPNDDTKLSARSGGSGKRAATDAGAEAQPLSGQQLLEQRAERQEAQKQRREQLAAKRQQRALEEEEARRAQEDADRKAAAAARKRALKKRQNNADVHTASAAPKERTYAVKGSKKMEQRLAAVQATAGTKASPRRISARKTENATPRTSEGETRAQVDAAVPASSSARKQRQEQRELAKDDAEREAQEEQELNGAASKLQARQRGRAVRRRVAAQKNELHGAASMLQARQRGRIARKHVAHQRAEMNGAASMLQARQRGRIARRHVAEQRTEMTGAASKLQARARGRIARKEMAQRKAEAAVAAAQQAAAVAAAAVAEAKAGESGAEDEEAYSDDDYDDDFSDDFEDDAETPETPADSDDADAAGSGAEADWTAREHAAAAVVQARHRGRATRRNVATRRAQARADRLEQEVAARQIQARHRGKLARKEASRRKEARRAPAQQSPQDAEADEDYEEDYGEDFSDFESQGEHTPVPKPDPDQISDDDNGGPELEAAARRIQARQRGKRTRQEIREQHRAAAKMQAVHRGRAARQRQAARQRKAEEAVAAAHEASLLAAALVEAAQSQGEGDDGYDDEGYDEDFDDDGEASLDVDELWTQMEHVGEPSRTPAKTTSARTNPTSPALFPSGEEFGELTAMPAVRAIAPATGQEVLSPAPSMREEVASLSLGTPSATVPVPQPAAAVHDKTDGADDNYSDFDDDEFGSLDADDIWDQPAMKADPLVPG